MKAIYNLCHHCAVAFPRDYGTCPECGVLASRAICMNCGVSWKKTAYVPYHPYPCQEAPLPAVGVWNPGFPGQQPYEPEKSLDSEFEVAPDGKIVPKYNPDWAEQEILTVNDFDVVCPSMAPRQETLFEPEEMASPVARWCIIWKYKRKVYEAMIFDLTGDGGPIPFNEWRVHPISYNLPTARKAQALTASLRLQFPGKSFACRRVQ